MHTCQPICMLTCAGPSAHHHSIDFIFKRRWGDQKPRFRWLKSSSVLSSLQMVTRGCETLEMTLRRNALGQLGFHVNFEGVVADVEPFGFAWQAGLRPGCRLVEICKVAVGTLTHEQMIDYLRTSTPVTVVVIQPHEDGTPRRYSLSSIFYWLLSFSLPMYLLKG